MEIKNLSERFEVRKLAEENLDEMLALCEKNTLFFQHCPPPPTKERLSVDLSVLPPNKTMADKFFVGLYDCENLVAICDIIKGYPNEKTILIGLLMLDIGLQGQGLGSKIALEMFEHFKEEGYENVELSYIKGNPQSKAFWHKMGFNETGREVETDDYTKVCMIKHL